MLTLVPSVTLCWDKVFRSLDLSLIAKESKQSVTILYYIIPLLKLAKFDIAYIVGSRGVLQQGGLVPVLWQ